MRQKGLGIWRSYTWQDSYQQVRQLSLGLMRLGLERGDKVCIIGDNDPQYFWAQLAVQSGGGVAVGIFTDSTPQAIQSTCRVKVDRVEFVPAQDIGNAGLILDQRTWE